jgi:hypothetical protein
MYKLTWSRQENHYNPLLLMPWKANMDIQANRPWPLLYVTGYVTKVEKSNMQEVWQVSSHQTIYSKLWSFAVRCLRSRECG